MGSRAAYKEACRRWGGRAVIWYEGDFCHVGVLILGYLFWSKGSGKTWALAFRDADKRAGKHETAP
jgi:hypothetical protein